MFQVIVSVMSSTFNPTGPISNRPHNWVAAQNSELDVILASLSRHATKDMRFNDDEVTKMTDIVKHCWDNKFKNIVSPFGNDEFISVAILDEYDMDQRDKELNALLGLTGGEVPVSTLH